MRVTSSLWVSALVRKAQSEGAFATIIHKGAAEAGAIFVVVNNLAGHCSLFGPALQAHYDLDGPGERKFECLLDEEEPQKVDEKVTRERSFDPDIWVVEIEDRQARSFIDPSLIVSP